MLTYPLGLYRGDTARWAFVLWADRARTTPVDLAIELAQLRAQAAQREFDGARDELQKLVVSLKVEGYTLDLQSLTYTKDTPPPPPKK